MQKKPAQLTATGEIQIPVLGHHASYLLAACCTKQIPVTVRQEHFGYINCNVGVSHQVQREILNYINANI